MEGQTHLTLGKKRKKMSLYILPPDKPNFGYKGKSLASSFHGRSVKSNSGGKKYGGKKRRKSKQSKTNL